MVMERISASVMVNVVVPDIDVLGSVAVMMVWPLSRAVARPVASMVAFAGFVDDQRAWDVRSWVVLSVNVPVALNCLVRPFALDGFGGVTEIETSSALLTVRSVFPDTSPDAAVMVAVPTPAPVASPALSIVAVDASDVVQVTDEVRSWVVLSVKVPVAVNCFFVPSDMLGFAGVTAMDVKAAPVTVSTVVPDILPDVAVIVVVPMASPDARPELSTVAMALSDDDHVTEEVTSWVVLSE